MEISSEADNKGMTYVVAKLFTTAMPAAAIVRRLARQSLASGTTPRVKWRPRARNDWADMLSKGYCGGERAAEVERYFDPRKRRTVDWARFLDIRDDVLKFG